MDYGVIMCREQVAIPIDKPCIFLEGQDSSLTTITYDAHERTDLSATFASRPTSIVAKGITFKVRVSAFPIHHTLAISFTLINNKICVYDRSFMEKKEEERICVYMSFFFFFCIKSMYA
jgi:pectinesterase